MASNLQTVIASLTRAVAALQEAQVFLHEVAQNHKKEDLAFRMAQAGFIQYFAFTFELARNVIQRWLREHAPRREDVDLPVTRRDLFRFAAVAGLLENPQHWFSYADARNATSHTYNAAVAADVRSQAEAFLFDVQVLLRRCIISDD